MKIAFFVTTFPLISETFILNQIAGLIDRGHEVDVFANEIGRENGFHREYLKYRMAERTRLRRLIPTGSRTRRIAVTLALVARDVWRHPITVPRAISRFLRDRPNITLYDLHMALRFLRFPSYDIVHCHFGPNADDAAILAELGVYRGKIVATFHGYDIRKGIATSGEAYSRVIRHCDAVYSISGYNQRWLERFGFSRERIIYHPVGIDVGSFPLRSETGKRSDGDSVHIVTVARLVEEKGLEYAIDAIADIRRRFTNTRIRYTIIGGGPLEGALKDAAYRRRMDDVVVFMGPQDQSVVREVLSKADLFLLPSVAEALPVSIMEAMASSLPVIATDVGSVAELVRDGKTGRLVPAADSKALARTLLEMLDARDGWPMLGEEARRLVENKYDVNMLNDRLVEHYRTLLSLSAKSAAA
jgi:colanic acid/amylovoran biosynthesis glycosyltransferase